MKSWIEKDEGERKRGKKDEEKRKKKRRENKKDEEEEEGKHKINFPFVTKR